MDNERLIESVAEGMWFLMVGSDSVHDWRWCCENEPEVAAELRFRARCCVKGSRIMGDPPAGLDLRFKRAFVGDV